MVLRYLIRNLLHQTVRRKVHEKVVEAAEEGLAAAAGRSEDDPPEDDPGPCDVGVVFALGIEAGGLEDLLSGVVTRRGDRFLAHEGGLGGRRVVVVQSGPGREAAARATEALICGHQPRWIISAGFAGGLTAGLKRHDLLMVDGLVDVEGHRLAIDLKVDPAALAQMPSVHLGRLLTADRIVRKPDEKRSLGEKHAAVAVDMETFAVAGVCRRRKVRFLAVRIISDAVDDELPPDVEKLMRQKSLLRKFGAVAGTLVNRPGSVKDIYRLKENALVASDRLARFLASTVEQLVPRTAPGGGKLPSGVEEPSDAGPG
jgi:adenosylhomocysteine nucleosidase